MSLRLQTDPNAVDTNAVCPRDRSGLTAGMGPNVVCPQNSIVVCPQHRPAPWAHGAEVVDRQQMLICGATAGIVKVGVTVKFRLNLPDAWFRLSCATGKFDLKSGEGKLRSWYSRRSATG
mgnify:CR=1 FL=1